MQKQCHTPDSRDHSQTFYTHLVLNSADEDCMVISAEWLLLILEHAPFVGQDKEGGII